MLIKHIANFEKHRQDGAIWKDLFFSFNHAGECMVYDMKFAVGENICDLKLIDSFTLDKTELITPHCNSVVFGKEYYSPDDEFPVLYANIYNNYEKEEEKHTGVCLVYRIFKTENKFYSELLQIIEIGFTKDSELWCSEGNDDIRPFGNFVTDVKENKYYAFTMRDKTKTTRYFSFKLPKISDGIFDEKYGVKKVCLEKNDIETYFDCEYHNFIQGACFYDGKIYSVEGFSVKSGKKPAIRVIDVKKKIQIIHKEFSDFDIDSEPEMIDFYGGQCYYADGSGKMYKIGF